LLLKPASTSNEVTALNVEISNLQFQGAKLETNSLIEVFKNTKANIQKSSFKDVRSLNRGAVISVDGNFVELSLEINDSSFENCNSIQGGVFVAIGGSKIEFNNTTVP